MIFIWSLLFKVIERSLKGFANIFTKFKRVMKILRRISFWVFLRFSWLRENVRKLKEKGISQGLWVVIVCV